MNCIIALSHTSSPLDSSFSSQPNCIHDHDAENGHNHATNYNIPSTNHICEDNAWETPDHTFCLPNLSAPPLSEVVSSEAPKSTCLIQSDLGSTDASAISLSLVPETTIEQTHTPLYLGWNYYYHLPNDKNWNVDSYKIIMSNISTLEELMGMNELMTDNIIKNCMLFVMRVGVTPMWEDPQNRQGGCFSYKVTNKAVTQVWRKLMYLLCGYTLTIDPTHMDLVNGITISPKRGFCIVKIWMKDCSLQDPAVITNVDQLLRNGCLFKAHNPEF